MMTARTISQPEICSGNPINYFCKFIVSLVIMKSLYKRKLQALGLVTFGLILSGCALPGWMPGSTSDIGQAINPGEKVTLHFFTKIPNFDTGVALQSGALYQLKVQLLNNWIDSDIETNELGEPLHETGFANSEMPFEFLGITRRSQSHNWFELMLMQPNCKSSSLKGISDLSFDEANNSYNFVAACDGNLTLFVNDAYGFYLNNVGYANLGLSRVN